MRARIRGETKVCSRCKVDKPNADFNVAKDNKDKLASRCRKCNAERGREWHKANPERTKANGRKGHLRRTYGLALDSYEDLLIAQGNRCAICRNGLIENHTCVDHDHDTGTVRGVLCRKCNTGLGQFNDEPLIIEAALAYLLSTKGR